MTIIQRTREAFVRLFPVPDGLHWDDEEQAYVRTLFPPRIEHLSFLAAWQGFLSHALLGSDEGYTCRKRAYHGKHVVWDGTSFDEIKRLMPTAELHREKYVQIRGDGWIKTMWIGDVLVKGENGDVKKYTAEEFAIKYEVIV